MRLAIFFVAVSISSIAIETRCGSQGRMVSKDALTKKQQRLVPIAAFTANGKLDELGAALAEGLDAGWTVNEVKEVLVQMYAYAGFPRSLNALDTFINVLDERRSKGITDVIGHEPTPFPANESSGDRGRQLQARLVGTRATPRYASFAPEIDAFLKGHLFGDLLGRDNLDMQSRELATISALATLDGVDPQLASHFGVGLRVGLSEAQLRSLTAVIDERVGKQRGNNARAVLARVLRESVVPMPSVSMSVATLASAPLTITVRKKEPVIVEAAPVEHFTGAAQLQRLFQANEPSRASGASVSFAPRARTAWHTHPLGQTLIVTAGSGWVQQWGTAPQALSDGDVVWIPPGVKHWHGGTARSGMTHLAIQELHDGTAVKWMEAVSDEQYATVVTQ